MAEQLKSGQWLASRSEQGKTVLRMFLSEELAIEWEES